MVYRSSKHQSHEGPDITVVQPALAHYRLDFFRRLSEHYGKRFFVVHAGATSGATMEAPRSAWARSGGALRRIAPGIEWQPDVADLPVGRGRVIVLSGNPRQLSTLVLLVRAHMSGATVIWWGHLWSATSKRWRQALRFLPMRLADGLLFYTEVEATRFRERAPFPLKARSVAGLENGINTDPIISARTPYQSARRRRALLFLGRLTKKADLALALRALATMDAEAPDLHVIGDGPEREELERQARNLNIGTRVYWHGTIVDEAKIAPIANACRAFVYPGAVGLSLIHAMAYGLPCIVHNNPTRHMPEIAAFSAGETGLAFQLGSATALARTVTDLLSDEGRLDAMSETCIARTAEAFNTRDMARRFIALLETLTESSSPAHVPGRIAL